MEPVGDLGEIVAYRVIESLDSTSHGGASRAGRLIVGASARSSLEASSSIAEEPGWESKAATLSL